MTIRRRLPLSFCETVLAEAADEKAASDPEAFYSKDEESPLSIDGTCNEKIEINSYMTFNFKTPELI